MQNAECENRVKGCYSLHSRLRRGRVDLRLMLGVQRRTLESLAGRLDLVQRDADVALEALTDATARIADLEDQLRALRAGVGLPAGCGNGHEACCAAFCGPVLVESGCEELPAAIAELPWVASAFDGAGS